MIGIGRKEGGAGYTDATLLYARLLTRRPLVRVTVCNKQLWPYTTTAAASNLSQHALHASTALGLLLPVVIRSLPVGANALTPG